ncbi:T-cell immunoglobulin and mucin domain-containing protein 4 [Egretta garzetta]|nr:T-cell immunoglobulin and mucin domain-containing protein 4 [Egretta garzetta]
MSHFVLFHWIMIQIFIAHTASQTVIRGVIGQPVQLPCFYHVTRRKDISDMCWGRGPCPNSKCNNKILHTTGTRVTFRKSQRYSLQGYVSYGDVSLTIGKVKAEDAGTYCCRIEIPGWFNDIKKNMQLEVVRAPPVMTTTTRKAPVSPKSFRKPTSAPQSTSDHHTTAEITVLLTTATPEATMETNALPTFAVTANDTFPATIVTTSALPDFPTGFQTTDMRTKDDDVFCSAESVPLPGDTEVTTEFPSALLTAEGIKSAHPSLVVEDVLTVGEPQREPLLLQVWKISSNSCSHQAGSSTLPASLILTCGMCVSDYSILIACVIVVSILFILMLSSLFWKRGHTKKFIIKSLGPVEDIEKVFSDAEGENSIFSL